AELLSRTKTISGEVADLKKAADEADAKFTELAKTLGNIVIDGVPAGGEDEGVIKETVGTPRDFAAEGFEPKDHLEIGEALGAIDM
ncbi:serine--tRNA ligase, partial [Staphylococcus aureus]